MSVLNLIRNRLVAELNVATSRFIRSLSPSGGRKYFVCRYLPT
jgi:hypothetical protein